MIGQIVSARNYMSDSKGQPEDMWYSYDHIGNVANLSDSSGDETVEFAQDAFGNVLSSTFTGAWATDPSGRHETTKEIDSDIDMYYFWQRWYEPEVGRFCTVDGSGFSDGINLYSYCSNNSVIYIDSDGEKKRRYDQYEELMELWDCVEQEKDKVAKDAACVEAAEILCEKGGLVEQCMKRKGKWPLKFTVMSINDAYRFHTWCEFLTDDMKCKVEKWVHWPKPEWNCKRRSTKPVDAGYPK